MLTNVTSTVVLRGRVSAELDTQGLAPEPQLLTTTPHCLNLSVDHEQILVKKKICPLYSLMSSQDPICNKLLLKIKQF